MINYALKGNFTVQKQFRGNKINRFCFKIVVIIWVVTEELKYLYKAPTLSFDQTTTS